MAERRLIAFCPSGLANRIRVLTSARAIARATGRELRFLWPLTPACRCPFERLFEAAPDVETVTAEAIAGRPYRGMPDDLLVDRPEDELHVGFVSWLVRTEDYPGHRALMPALVAEVAALAPSASIRARVAEVAARFAPEMIGVHLRRGDFHEVQPRFVDNADAALALTALRLRERPRARVFLATDDGAATRHGPPTTEGVQARFRAIFSDRVVSARPRSLDRSTPEAIEDALVELLLLRMTDLIIGTVGSSFSDLGAFGRRVPLCYAPGVTPRLDRIEGTLSRMRMRSALMALARLRLGVPVDSFAMAWAALRHSPEGDVAARALARVLGTLRARPGQARG